MACTCLTLLQILCGKLARHVIIWAMQICFNDNTDPFAQAWFAFDPRYERCLAGHIITWKMQPLLQ